MVSSTLRRIGIFSTSLFYFSHIFKSSTQFMLETNCQSKEHSYESSNFLGKNIFIYVYLGLFA